MFYGGGAYKCISLFVHTTLGHASYDHWLIWIKQLSDEVTSGLKMLTIGPVLFVYESIEYDVKWTTKCDLNWASFAFITITLKNQE